MSRICTAHSFHPVRKEWIGVVYQPTLFGKKVLTVGCLETEQGIKLWLARVVRTRAWETGSEPADKYSQPSPPALYPLVRREDR